MLYRLLSLLNLLFSPSPIVMCCFKIAVFYHDVANKDGLKILIFVFGTIFCAFINWVVNMFVYSLKITTKLTHWLFLLQLLLQGCFA